MSIKSFVELELDPRILDALSTENYTTPTPIQAQAIPSLMKGSDLLGIAQTGTGKTAAFVLPILHGIARKQKKAAANKPQALILAPTRELVAQIEASVKTYGEHLPLRKTAVFGGVGIHPQIKKITRGTHILVATPGRLLDLMKQGHCDLSQIDYFVMDEADRMLDMGFIHDIRQIVAKLPKKRQSLLFSATMPKDVAKLAEGLLNNPKRIEVTPNVVTVDRIDQRVYFCSANEKRDLLLDILKDDSIYRVIVFTRTKHRANNVTEFLNKKNITTEAIHGNKSQAARQRALRNFTKGDTRVLVATDVAARGIDIEGVTHVVNFELPNEAESYVHRIGRTARAGASGVALSFCSPDERPYLRDIEVVIKREITNEGERPFMENIPKKPKAGQRQGQKPRSRKKVASKGRKRKTAANENNAKPGFKKRGKPPRAQRKRNKAKAA